MKRQHVVRSVGNLLGPSCLSAPPVGAQQSRPGCSDGRVRQGGRRGRFLDPRCTDAARSHTTAFLFALVGVFHGAAAAEEQNLARNNGFEVAGQNGLPADWSGPTNVYQRDGAVARSGGASLRFINPDPNRYVLCSQGIRLEAGRIYEVGAWVKTQGIKGSDSGATICVEWYDEKGRYLGGAYPAGKKDDSDWALVKGTTSRIPPDAKSFSLACYVRQGMTGTAWWDDVGIRRTQERPLSTVLLVPNYRAQITDSGPEPVKIRAEFNLVDYDLEPKDISLGWSVVGEKDRVEHARGVLKDIASAAVDVAIPARFLPPGRHRIDITLSSKRSTRLIDNTSHHVVRVAGAPDRMSTIDANNRLIRDGKPFFPLGMYWGGISKEEIAVYADGPFNCLMPYGQPTTEQMDLAHKFGLKVIYTVKDIYHGTGGCPPNIKTDADELAHIRGKVEQFGRHPALLAWYLNDELDVAMMPRLIAHQRWMEELDPHHPTWVVLYQVDQVRHYIESFDVIGTDPYPVPSIPVSRAGEWTRRTVRGVAGARPVWMVPQVFNWACYKHREAEKRPCRPPTFDEMRCMAWQCIAEGATGLIFYSWFDIRRDTARPFAEHWPLVKKMAQEITDMIPVLLSIEPTPAMTAETAAWLNWRVKQAGEKTYLIVVNNSAEAHTVRFALTAEPKTVSVRGLPGQPSVDAAKTLSLPLPPLGVGLCEMTGLAAPGH